MTTLDRRLDPRNAVLTGLSPADPLSAELIVDQGHPFFFDHPLDHVPGLLLLESAVQLAQRSARDRQFVSHIEARFLKYAMFDDPVRLTARHTRGADGDVFTVAVVQRERIRAEITVGLTKAAGSSHVPDHYSHPLQACPGAPLNKRRAENVLIATPQIGAGTVRAEILPPPPGCLLTDSARVLHPLYLLECFMQVQRFLNAAKAEGGRMRDILVGVGFSRTKPTERPGAGLSVLGSTDFSETAAGRLSRSATIAAFGRPIAQCSLETACIQRQRLSA